MIQKLNSLLNIIIEIDHEYKSWWIITVICLTIGMFLHNSIESMLASAAFAIVIWFFYMLEL